MSATNINFFVLAAKGRTKKTTQSFKGEMGTRKRKRKRRRKIKKRRERERESTTQGAGQGETAERTCGAASGCRVVTALGRHPAEQCRGFERARHDPRHS